MRAACPTQVFFLYLITITILGDEDRLWSFATCSFVRSVLASSVVCSNILLITPFSVTLDLGAAVNMRTNSLDHCDCRSACVCVCVCVRACKCVRINPLSLPYNIDTLPLPLKDNLPHECQFLPVQLDNGPVLPNGNEYRVFRRKSSGQIAVKEVALLLSP
jgi:hypothetical protein